MADEKWEDMLFDRPKDARQYKRDGRRWVQKINFNFMNAKGHGFIEVVPSFLSPDGTPYFGKWDVRVTEFPYAGFWKGTYTDNGIEWFEVTTGKKFLSNIEINQPYACYSRPESGHQQTLFEWKGSSDLPFEIYIESLHKELVLKSS
jgi:hypothetical protein